MRSDPTHRDSWGKDSKWKGCHWSQHTLYCCYPLFLCFLLKEGMKYFYSTQNKLLSRWDRKGRMEVWQYVLCAVCFRTGRVSSPGIPRPPPRAEIQDCQNGFPQFWCKITSCTGGVSRYQLLPYQLRTELHQGFESNSVTLHVLYAFSYNSQN